MNSRRITLALALLMSFVLGVGLMPSWADEALEEMSTEDMLYVRGLVSKVYLDKMTGRNGQKFGASLQVDAANRTINFSDFKQEKDLDKKQARSKGAKQKVG